MNCLLIAATETEIAPFVTYYQSGEHTLPPRLNITKLITGIGLTATAYQLSKQLQQQKPDLVIQAGIAGCFDNTVALGSVVIVQEEIIADMGVMEQEQFKDMFDLQLTNANDFPHTNGMLVNKNTALLNKTGWRLVKGVSVNQITTAPKMMEWYGHKYKPVTESMEGAALHYVCIAEAVPFLQIRTISNYIGERDKTKWQIKTAIENLNAALIQLTTMCQL